MKRVEESKMNELCNKNNILLYKKGMIRAGADTFYSVTECLVKGVKTNLLEIPSLCVQLYLRFKR